MTNDHLADVFDRIADLLEFQNASNCAAARAHGVPIVISTDAHSTDGLVWLRYGILQARRAGLTRHDIANTRTLRQRRKMVAGESRSQDSGARRKG